MRRLQLLALLTLAACGAEGRPTPPQAEAPTPGVSVSGTAAVGVTAKL